MASDQDSRRKRRAQSERADEEVDEQEEGKNKEAEAQKVEAQKVEAEEAEVEPAAAAADNVADNANGAPTQRRQEYLVAHTRAPLPASVAPLNLQSFQAAVEQGQIPGITPKRVIGVPTGLEQLGLFASVPANSQAIHVWEMEEEQAKVLSQEPQLEVEPNLFLQLEPAVPTMSTASAPAVAPPAQDPSVLRPLSGGFQATIRVLGRDGNPLPEAEVYVFGIMQHAGITDGNGQVQLSLFGEAPFSISGLYIKPKRDHWDRWVARPAIDANAPYQVTLRRLDDTFLAFPDQEVVDWGLKAMKIDQLTPAGQFTGQGIKVAVVDSGTAGPTHQDLQGQVQTGFNIITQTVNGWEQDEQSHGTHCAGVIAGLNNNRGIRGIAPAAKLFIYKIFPGGQFDHLIDALDRCISDGVDVVNLSLGADQGSARVDERLRMAKESGVACIVAAGNSAGPVKFPASSPHVLAVAAIGQQGTFPVDSYHANQLSGSPDASGYFSAKFSCFGPEVDVCAPGVAVLSTVPPDGYAAWDGTSMAGPHVAGLAALLLAHHPDFQRPPYNQRNAQRVERLFQIIKQTAQPLNLGGSSRTGAGLPDAQRAFSQAVAVGPSAGTTGTMASGMQALLTLWK